MAHIKPGIPLQRGVSLIELMVAMVIGLLTTLVVMQVFSVFEGDKRTTTSGADAQTNGTVALYQIKRQMAIAGYGLPILGGGDPGTNIPFSCTKDEVTNTDLNLGGVGLFPIVLVDGAGGASDSVLVRSGTSATGGVPLKVIGGASSVLIGVDNSSGCQVGDLVLLSNNDGTLRCTAGPRVTAVSDTQITLSANSPAWLGTAKSKIACIRGWSQTTYSVDANKGALLSGATELVDGIVSIQAQYGVAGGKNSNVVAQWVDPTGAYASGSVDSVAGLASRQLIRAIRIAVVARSGLREKDDVTSNALNWAGGAIDIADLPGADPQKFRYRVFETVIPLRNIIWSSNSL